jgi:hypothetical protein
MIDNSNDFTVYHLKNKYIFDNAFSVSHLPHAACTAPQVFITWLTVLKLKLDNI